jgi:hypothetical protein
MFPSRPQHGFVMEHNFMMKPKDTLQLKKELMKFVSELQDEVARKRPRFADEKK